MPAPDRILSEIKGRDLEDTGERQMGAFMGLVKMIDDMAYGLGRRYVSEANNTNATPDERRIRLAYQTAYADLWHKVTNKEGHVYDHDADLLNEMLQKFFSESFRAQYFQANQNAAAAYRAYQTRTYGGPKGAQPNRPLNTSAEPSTPNVASGSQPAAGSVGASHGSDPSIAKARAAHVDTQVLGLALGEPVQIPQCASMFSMHETTCIVKASELLNSLGLGDDPGTREHTMMLELSQEACPSWSQDCEARLMTYDGLLVAIDLKTKGHNVDQAVARNLREKYGRPTSVKPLEATPRVGNSIKVNDLEWVLPGLHVVYDVFLKGESEGEVANIEMGNIGFETEAAYQRRLARAKPKVKL
jgi:hypothetical protein